MFYRAESGITNKSVSGDRGAYGFLSVLSRRAHLLTTDCIAKQCVSAGVLPAADVRSTRLCGGTKRQFFYNRYTRKEVIAYRHIPS